MNGDAACVPTGTPQHRRRALLALAVSAFSISVTEFVIAGTVPQVAASFRIWLPTAGLLASGYALGVLIGAPVVTMAVRPLPRKTVLLGLLVLFVAGNVLTAPLRGSARCWRAAPWRACALAPSSAAAECA